MNSENSPPRPARHLLLLAGVTLLLHLPFFGQPVQGDEVNYLDMARQVFEQPLTPLNFRYVFQGREVDMSGHPHPPLNAYILAGLWALRGEFSPGFFHAAYLVFPLVASFAAYALAARFTAHPLWAALLVASAPLVQINTNTLGGSEAPALAFGLAGAAFFVWRRFAPAAVFLALAGMTALQTLALGPILLLDYAIARERPPRAALIAAAAPIAVMAGWQVMQFSLTGRLPLAVLFGYATGVDYGRPALKLASAVALLQHLGVLIVFLGLVKPVLRPAWLAPAAAGGAGALAAMLATGYPWWERFMLLGFAAAGVNALVWLWGARRDQPFLAGWCLAYFAFACAAFFAGSARYLLPLAAPLVLLFVRHAEAQRWKLAAALAINVVLGLNLSFAAYEFSRAYADLEPPPGSAFLVNGEWGFRYHMVRRGGRPLERSSRAAPGEWIVSSELSLAGNYDSPAEAIAVPMSVKDVTVRSPLRLVDRFAHSGHSSVAFGLLPFSFSRRPLDQITYWRTSPFISLDAAWLPTQFAGRLVYLPSPGAAIRLPLDPSWTHLYFALFARGNGRVIFRIREQAGAAMLEQQVDVSGELWEVYSLPLNGLREAVLSVDAPPNMRAGWGQLVAY